MFSSIIWDLIIDICLASKFTKSQNIFYLFIFTKEKPCTRTKAEYWVEHILLCKWGDVTNFFTYHSFTPKVTEFCLYILIIIRLRKQYGEVFKSMGSEARLPSFKPQQLPRAVTFVLNLSPMKLEWEKNVSWINWVNNTSHYMWNT